MARALTVLAAIIVSGVITLAVSCRTTKGPHDASRAFDDASIGPVVSLIPAERLRRYQAALPKVAYQRLADIFANPSTIWYDHEAVPPAYQDTVGATPTYMLIGPRLNSAGRELIVDPGKHLFLDNGSAWAFPFSKTAGTDRSDNVAIVDFLHLPVVNGVRQTVAIRKSVDPRWNGTLGLSRVEWTYPKGATFGELIFVKASNGDLLPVEVRIRTRYLDGWATNAFRPFPTADSFITALKAARPNWQSEPQIASLVTRLTSATPMQSLTLESTAFPGSFKQQGYIDVLPEIDEGLVKTLLRGTPFISAYGLEWRSVGDAVAYAPSSEVGTSIVPRRYQAGLIEVRDESCARCHQDAGKMVKDYVGDAILYGDIWGTDRIFSLHPFAADPSLYLAYGDLDNRRIRRELRAVFVPFDPTRHTAEHYKWLPRPDQTAADAGRPERTNTIGVGP